MIYCLDCNKEVKVEQLYEEPRVQLSEENYNEVG
jgi:hypothetical protein